MSKRRKGSPSSAFSPPHLPQAERVHAYARDVVSGAVVAGWMVRAAGQRHLDDMEHAHERGLVWLASRAEGAINFFERTLFLDEGVPFKLVDFQAFKIGSLYGWWRLDDELLAEQIESGKCPFTREEILANFAEVSAGRAALLHVPAKDAKKPPLWQVPVHRRFRIAYWEEGKGNGKTPTAAGLGLLHLVMEFDSAPECYSAAAAKEQARICFDDAARMRQASPDLRKLVCELKGSLTIPSLHAKFIPLSSEDRGQHGKRVSFAALDEVHAHYSGKMARAMIAGTKNCKNALILLPTNSGHDRRSLCWQYHETARRILEGEIQRDDFFAYVCTLDPCPKCRSVGWRQPAPKCRRCDDWRDDRTWIKANPGLGKICRRAYVAERVEQGKTQPSELNDVLQLNFCLWTESAGGWANMHQWDNECADTALKLEDFAGRRATIAMDAANRVDITSLVAVIEREPGSGTLDPERLNAAAKAALAQSIARQQADAANAAPDEAPAATPEVRALSAAGYVLFDWHFVPEAMVENSNQPNHDSYTEWRAAGELIVTPGAVTDFGAIMGKIRELAALLKVIRFQCDPRELGYFMQQLQAQDWCTFEVVEVSQSPAMISQPMKELEALIAAGLIKHTGSRPLRWMVANVVQKTTSSGGPIKYYFPTRSEDSKKIDGAVSLIMGLDGILRTAEPETMPGGMMLG